jgi:hypothetical protein
MNDATLNAFRAIAAAMAGPEPQTWQWIGPWPSQRMFGITQARAETYAAKHGGTASPMATNDLNRNRGPRARTGD